MKRNTYLGILCAVTIVVCLVAIAVNLGGCVRGAMGMFSKGEYVETEFEKDFTNVKEISLDVDVLNVTIKTGDSFKVSYEGDKRLEPSVEFKESSGKLTVTQKNEIKLSTNGKSYKSELTVIVPEDVKLDRLKVKADVGNAKINDIKTAEFIGILNMGNITTRGITADSIDVDADMGNCEMFETTFEKAVLDMDMGNAELESVRNVKDYDIKAKCSMGNVKIDGEKVSGSYNHDGNGAGSINASCSMGNVTIYTK